jgi:hypothetical protein
MRSSNYSHRSMSSPSGRLTGYPDIARGRVNQLLGCRQPFRYAPEWPTTGKVRVVRDSPGTDVSEVKTCNCDDLTLPWSDI